MTLWEIEWEDEPSKTGTTRVCLGLPEFDALVEEMARAGGNPVFTRDYLDNVNATIRTYHSAAQERPEPTDDFEAMVQEFHDKAISMSEYGVSLQERLFELWEKLVEKLEGTPENTIISLAKMARYTTTQAFLAGFSSGEGIGFVKGQTQPLADVFTANKANQAYRKGGRNTGALKTEEDWRLFAIERQRHGKKWTKLAEVMTKHGRKMSAKTAKRCAEKLTQVDTASDGQK